MNKIRIISDVHGKYDEYLKIIEECEYSVQLGDLGFDYSFLDEVNIVRTDCRHRFIGGNHDNYDQYDSCLSSLPNYGMWNLNGVNFYYVRGSVSIDCVPRVKHYILTGEKTWWYEEELSNEDLADAIEDYSLAKPDIMLTHDCPSQIKGQFSNANVMQGFGWPPAYTCRTQQVLGVMFNAHKPKLWIFGHWHRTIDMVVDGTRFICMPELGCLDLVAENGEYTIIK